MGLIIAILAVLFFSNPAWAQAYAEESVQVSPWQDLNSSNGGSKKIAMNNRAQQSKQASNSTSTSNNPGYRNSLPPTATSCVNLSICEASPPPPEYSGSSGGGGVDTSNLPPPPGEGYQPIMQHGVFVGYMSPALISLMQTDPRAAWTAFARSSDFVGPDGLRLSLLAETGAATPEEMAALYQMALFGG